jgi:hypothetical protein
MANPNPQHNPTDGLLVAAYVQVTGTNVVNNSGGAAAAQGTVGFPLGQGIGAAPSTHHPVAQYELTLSLSSATVNTVSYHNTCTLTTVLKDVANTTYTPVGSPVYKSYNYPAFSGYNPSNAISGNGLLANQVAYSALIASVGASNGVVTAAHVGQAIIEVQFPVFDFVQSSLDPEPTQQTGNPVGMIYAQVVVNVIP